MKKMMSMAVAAMLATTVFAERPVTPESLETLKHSLIHRGDGKGRPDNTMEALLYTWAKGYTPESDIRYTKDGKIVASNDKRRLHGPKAEMELQLSSSAVKVKI